MNPTVVEERDRSQAPAAGTARKVSVARRVHDDIERALKARRAHGTTREAVENAVKARGLVLWGAMKRHPFVTMAAVGACGVVAAAAVGVYEVAFGCALAIAAYKVVREGEPPISALSDVVHEVRG